jgi:hypothetical protein
VSVFQGKLTVPGVFDWPLSVDIDVRAETLSISSGGGTIGAWSLEEIELIGHDDGFELHASGDVVRFSTADDGRFAYEVGLQWAPPRLRRLMAAQLHEDGQARSIKVVTTRNLRSQFSIDGPDSRPTPQAEPEPRPRKGKHRRSGRGRHLRVIPG